MVPLRCLKSNDIGDTMIKDEDIYIGMLVTFDRNAFKNLFFRGNLYAQYPDCFSRAYRIEKVKEGQTWGRGLYKLEGIHFDGLTSYLFNHANPIDVLLATKKCKLVK